MITRRAALAGAAAAAASYGRIAVGQTREPIRVGVLTPLSGPGESSGVVIKAGVEIAVAQINRAGGVGGRPLALEFRDDKANAAQATAMARELLGLGINLLTGTNTSGVAAALGPVMQQENGVLLATLPSAASVNHESFNPNVFRGCESPLARMRGLAQIAARRYSNVLKWSAIIPDTDYGHSAWAMFVDGLLSYYPTIAGRDPEILEPVVARFGSADFRNHITALMRLPFEGLFHGTYGADTVTFFQQARPFGLVRRTRVIVDSGSGFVVAKAMRNQTPPWWGSVFWYPDNHRDNPISNQLHADYAARFSDLPPEGFLAEAHADILAFAKAIAAARSTETAPVIAALKGLEWDSATGPRVMRREDNQVIKDIEAVYIEPAENPQGYVVSSYTKFPGAELVEPPTPGVALRLRAR